MCSLPSGTRCRVSTQLQMPNNPSSSAPSCLRLTPCMCRNVWLTCLFSINPARGLIINVKLPLQQLGGGGLCAASPAWLPPSVIPGRTWLWLVFLTEILPQEKGKMPPASKQVPGLAVKMTKYPQPDSFYLISFVFQQSKNGLNLWCHFTLITS